MATRFLISLAILTIVLVAGCGVDEESRPGKSHADDSRPAAPLTARDDSTGIGFRVSDNGRVVTATDQAGRVVWAVDVIEKAGAPAVGAPIIRHLSVLKGQVAVVYGKHSFANLEPRTGNLLSSGSD